MLLHLDDNATSSLNMGLSCYEKYLNMDVFNQDINEIDGNLKFAIIGIQNAVELYIKKLLSDINELFIYEEETINDSEVLKFIGKKFELNNKLNLSSFMANYGERFKTISFQKCLQRFTGLFDINDTDIEVLKRLNQYRNVMTHFGLEDISGVDNIIFTINDALHIISYVLIPLINIRKEKINKELIDEINGFIESNNFKFYEVWFAANEYIISEYYDEIKNIVSNDCDLEEIFGDEIKLEIEEKSIVFWGKQNSFLLNRIDIPKKNMSALVNSNDNIVLAILDYNEIDNLYMYCPVTKMKYMDLIKMDSCKWRNSSNKQFNKVPLNHQTFISKVLNRLPTINI